MTVVDLRPWPSTVRPGYTSRSWQIDNHDLGSGLACGAISTEGSMGTGANAQLVETGETFADLKAKRLAD